MTNVVGIANDTATASGRLLTITDASYEMSELVTFDVNPVQLGKGVPSPTNRRYFDVVTSVTINRAGKNLFRKYQSDFTDGKEYDSDGTLVDSENCTAYGGVYTYFSVVSGETYAFQFYKDSIDLADVTIVFYNSAKVFLSTLKFNDTDPTIGIKSVIFTAPQDSAFIHFSLPKQNHNIQIEFGSASTDYENYSGQTLYVSLGYSSRGGKVELNPNTGNYVYKPYKYYSSYNGEQLVGPWVSSENVYEERTTPTVGAAVIDLGATASPPWTGISANIRTTLGVNYIWLNMPGNISVTYHVLTVLNAVANLVYTEQVNTESKIKPGAVCSACLQFDLFNDDNEDVNIGDLLEYYQISDDNTQTLIGLFSPITIEQKRAKKTIIAYDNIIKLEADFSRKLAQLQNSFPISGLSLAYAAGDVAGVQVVNPATGLILEKLSGIDIPQFYTDKITCRQIISWLAEIACCFAKCNTQGELYFDWYEENEDYRIYPTSGSSETEEYVFYKMNGLSYDKEISAFISYVKINVTNDPGNDYYYPTSSSQIYAIDTTGQGDLEIQNIDCIDTWSSGNVILQNPILYTFDTSGEGNLSILEEQQSVAHYEITDNLLLTNADDDLKERIAKNIYDTLNALPTFRNAQVDLFRFNNPFKTGDIAKVTDILGVSFVFPVIRMECTSGGDKLTTDNLYYENYGE